MRAIHILRALGVVLNTLIWAVVVIVLSPFDRDAKIAYRGARLWVWFNRKLSGVRVTVRGLEKLAPGTQYVFMSNHRSNADIIAIAWALWDYQLRWVAKRELLSVPMFGWALRALRMIIIDRSNREEAIESYRRARERIRRGISVMVFPEGTRGAGEELLPFKKGGFVFAIETETPIAPVAVRGTAAVLARNGWQIDAGDVEVVVGTPIPTAGRTLEDRDLLVEEVRSAIQTMMSGEEHRPGGFVGKAVNQA